MAPSMFSSRRRAASNPGHQNATPTPSAALAATQAFLKDRQSNASLSSAAAAAALTKHPTSPTPVAQIQTKRMVRRNSNSSVGSASDAGRNGGGRELRRQNSSGSMTERTFRSTSPSPNRGGATHAVADPNAPPVPAIPKRISESPDQGSRRSSSLEPQGRIMSPVTHKQGGRGASVDTATRRISQRSAVRSPPEAIETTPDVSSSPRSSINFSRPYSPSPPTSPASTGKGWHTSPVVSNARPRQDSSSSRRSKLSQTTQLMITSDNGAYSNAKSSGIQASKHAAGSEQPPLSKADRILSAANQYSSTHSVLHKKPSVIEEDPQELVKSPAPISPTREMSTSQWAIPQRAATVATPSKRPEEKVRVRSSTESNVQPAPSLVQATLTPGGAKDVQNRSRQSSISPSRSAHFSASPVETPSGVRHQPLPRSISPAKSALKNSPSVRNASPSVSVASRQGGSTLSETSDNVSDDGLKSATRRKKSVRVSFDAEPVIAGYAVGPITPISSAGTGFPSETAGDDSDDVLKPTPALPSFGSIRSSPRRSQESEVPEKVTETVPSSMTNSASTLVEREPQISSGDGATKIVAQDFATEEASKAQGAQEPLPPEVTSVEGSGYMSDSSSSSGSEEASMFPTPRKPQETSQQTAPIPSDNFDAKSPAELTLKDSVPVIAVLPATPAAVENQRLSADYLVPGGFPDDYSEPEPEPEPKAAPIVKQDVQNTIASQAPKETSETPPAKPRSALTSEALAQLIPDDSSSSSDNESIYSDAEENVADYEHGGFASLDAIVESPINPKIGLNSLGSSADERSNTLKILESIDASTAPSTSVTAEAKPAEYEDQSSPAETRSSRVQKMTSMPKTAVIVEPETAEKSAPTPVVKPKKKKKKAAKTATREQVTLPISSPYPPLRPSTQAKKDLAKQRQGDSSASARSSNVQAGKPAKTQPGQTTVAGGLRASKYSQPEEPRGTLQKKHLPSSASSPRPAPGARKTSAQDKTSAIAIAQATYPNGLGMSQRNDSEESVSSFRRNRRTSDTSRGGRMTMRATMRQGAPSSRPMSAGGPAPKSSRFSVRSSSPTGSVLSDSRVRTMRTSLRGSVDLPPMSVRPSSQAKEKSKPSRSSIFGRDKVKSTAPASSSIGARFTSRFADSSDDEDEDNPSLPPFRSRFVDSDDERDTKLTPVRGIPRKPGAEDGDSTDLEDSDDGGRAQVPGKGTKKTLSAPGDVTVNGKANGVASSKHADPSGPGVITSMSGSETQKKRRSFFSFGKKKGVSAPAVPAVEPVRPQTPPTNADIQNNASPSSPTSPSRSPKLQRRSMPQPRPAGESSWPLPSVREADEPERPRTADGIGSRKTMRPSMGSRMDSAPPVPALPSVHPDGTATIGPSGFGDIRGRSGKKKRFPGLRKVFGLND